MGGRLSIKSAPDRGTTVGLVFPPRCIVTATAAKPAPAS
jgi:hypothetical protein